MEPEYELKETTTCKSSAKIIEYQNPSSDLNFESPGLLFSIVGKEDVEHFQNINEEGVENLIGSHIPYHYLSDFAEDVDEALNPTDQFMITDGGFEALYYGNLQDRKSSFYKDLPFSKEELDKVKEAKGTRSTLEKSKLIRKAWASLANDSQRAVNFVHEFTAEMRKLDMPFITAPAPFVTEETDLDMVAFFYRISKAYFSGDEVTRPEKIAMELNLRKKFIEDEDRRQEIYDMLYEEDPEAIILRIPDMGDVREESTTIEEAWAPLISQLGAYSEEQEVPFFYVSTSTEGPVSIMHGADAFVARPTKAGDLKETEFGGDPRKLWKENPYLSSGKIREYDGKRRLLTRKELIETLDEKGEWPYPFDVEVDKDRIEDIRTKKYRELAKEISSKVYSQEIKEIKQGIRNDEIPEIRSKYKDWMPDLDLFPDSR